MVSGRSRRGANPTSLIVLIALVAHCYGCPSCAFIAPVALPSHLEPPAVRCRKSSRCIIIASSKPSTPSPPPPSSPPPKPARAAMSDKKKTPAGTTPLTFGGRVRRSTGEREVERPSPGTASGRALGTAVKDDEDVRKSARWGAKLASPPKLGAALKNPLEAVGLSLRTVGQGATAVKDALYDAAGGIANQGSLPKLTQQENDEPSKGGVTVSSKSSTRVTGALKTVGGGAVIAKDAFWGTLGALGGAVDAIGKSPDTFRSFAAGAGAALQDSKANAEAVARAPGAAVSAASGGVASVLGAAKESVYGAAEATTRLARAPRQISEQRRRQQQERERSAAVRKEREAERKETARKLVSTVTAAKEVVWGTVEGAGALVDTVAATPAAVSEGLGKAQAAAKSAGELLESIPRTAQEIPREAQRRVDGVRAWIDSVQNTGKRVVSTVSGGVDGTSKLFQRGVAEATGEERRKREEKQRREAEERRKEERKLVVKLEEQPYTAQGLTGEAVKAAGTTARGVFQVGKGLVSTASVVASVPVKVARVALGPVYEYQQSRMRVRDAIEQQQGASLQATSTSSPPTTTTAAPAPSIPEVARVALGPVYEYQQSRKRVRDAIEQQQGASLQATSTSSPPSTTTAARALFIPKVARVALGPVYEYQQSRKRVRAAIEQQQGASLQATSTSSPPTTTTAAPAEPASSPTEDGARDGGNATAAASSATASVTKKGRGEAAADATAMTEVAAPVATTWPQPAGAAVGGDPASDDVGKPVDSRRSWSKFDAGRK